MKESYEDKNKKLLVIPPTIIENDKNSDSNAKFENSAAGGAVLGKGDDKKKRDLT